MFFLIRALRSFPGSLAILAICVSVAGGAANLAAQTVFPASRLDFDNAYRQDVEIAFPNARTSAGSSPDDMLWKAFPKEVAARADTWRVSGLRIGFRVDKSYTGALPNFLSLPNVRFYPLIEKTIEGRTFCVPDVTKPFASTFPLGGLRVVQAGVQNFELRVGTSNADPRLHKPIELPARDAQGKVLGWAVALAAPFGARAGNGQVNFVAVPSFGEIHRSGSRSSYSGLYDATTKKVMPFGTTGAPSNLGELAVELFFDQPTLQVFSDGAGGVRKDPRGIETHKGPGAYDNGLGSAANAGFFGLYTQFEGQSGLFALPIVVSTSGRVPESTLSFEGVNMLYDAQGLGLTTLFTGAGVLGKIGDYKAGGAAGHRQDQRGVWQSGRLSFGKNPALAGFTVWVQALMFDATKMSSVGTSNALRLRF